jgi:hypothetical protein
VSWQPPGDPPSDPAQPPPPYGEGDPAWGGAQPPPPPPPGWSGQQNPYGQPQYGGSPYGYGAPPKVPNYLVYSILSTIFCCLPAGVVSIVYAAQVNSKLANGDYAGAAQSSKNARTWAIVSAVVGLVGVIIWIVAVAGTSSST